MSSKYALIIGSTEYSDTSLPPLTAPGRDVEDLARVLNDPEICAFDQVNIVLNQPHFAVSEAIDEFFEQKKKDDLLVLYFSGHGIRDEYGALYLAFKNTNRFRLRSTAIKSDFIRDAMDQCRSKRQILILDCCNSGAFPHGTKGRGLSLGTSTAFNTGYGRIILTASDAVQYAWEGETLFGETENSLFTHFLVKGLQGSADHNGDGEITVDELYDYAFESVKTITPKQTPSKFSSGQQGEILLRQLTEAQREARRLQELEDKQRREQEEAERLETIRAEKETALKLAEELRISRENAEAAAREASERVLQERAKLEAIEREIAQRTAAQETLAEPRPKVMPATRAKYLIAAGAVIAGLIIIFASYTLRQGNSPSPTAEPTTTEAAEPAPSTIPVGVTQVVESDGIPLTEFYTPQQFNYAPIAAPLTLDGTSLPASSEVISVQNATNVTQLARWGNGGVSNVVYSPDGKTVALATSIGIYLLDAKDLTQRLFIDTQRSMKRVKFMPDGETIIGVSRSGDILRYRTDDGSFLGGNTQPLRYLNDADFSPDGSLIAVALTQSRNPIFLIRSSDGSLMGTLEVEDDSGRAISQVQFSPDGKLLLSASRTAIYLWDMENLTLIRSTAITESYRTELTFSPDGTQFAYIDSNTSSIKILSVQDGSLLYTLEGHDASPFALAFANDGRQMYYSIGDGGIRVRQIDTGTLEKSLQPHEQYVRNIVFSPDESSFITVAGDASIKLWDATQSTLTQTKTGFFEDLQNVSISADNSLIAVSSEPILIRSLSDGEILQSIDGGYWPFLATFLSTGQTLMTTAEGNGNIEFWNFEDDQFVIGLETYIYPYNNTAVISPNQRYIASAEGEYNIELTQLDMQNAYVGQPQVLSGHTDEITKLAFSPDSTLLVSVSYDGTARLWNVVGGTFLKILTDHLDDVYDAAFSPKGGLLATSSGDGTILLRDMDGNVIRSMEFPTGDSPDYLEFSPDGKILAASTSRSNNIVLLDVNTGTVIHTLSGHTEAVVDMQFTSNGKLLVSSAYDETIRIWGIQP